MNFAKKNFLVLLILFLAVSCSHKKTLPPVVVVEEDSRAPASFGLVMKEKPLPPIENVQTNFQKSDGRSVQDIRRVAHARHYGCLEAKFEVIDNDIPNTKAGIFKLGGKTLPAWIRFSAASGSTKKNDKDPDLKGLAIKVVGVEGLSATDPNKQTHVQDFLFTNRPIPFVKNVEEQLEFFKATSLSKPQLFLLKHPQRAKRVIQDTNRRIESIWTESYWSRLPFSMWTNEGMPPVTLGDRIPYGAKFVIYPCNSVPGRSPELNKKTYSAKSKNYLFEDFMERISKADQCFELAAQLQNTKDLQVTPIEDPMVEWKTKPIALARIRIPKNQILHVEAAKTSFESYQKGEEVRGFCEQLSFSPWNALQAHTPLGRMNKARLQVMSRSQNNRAEKSGYDLIIEPDIKTFHYLN